MNSQISAYLRFPRLTKTSSRITKCIKPAKVRIILPCSPFPQAYRGYHTISPPLVPLRVLRLLFTKIGKSGKLSNVSASYTVTVSFASVSAAVLAISLVS